MDTLMVIDDPAAAVAAARCVTARSVTRTDRAPVTSQHPRTCAWCDYPLDVLAPMVAGFLAWAEPKDQGMGTVYGRHDVRVFFELPRAEQERQITEAQGLVDVTPRGEGSAGVQGAADKDRTAAVFPVGQVQEMRPEGFEPAAAAPVTEPVEAGISAWTGSPRPATEGGTG
jgi:hypothetical protein